MPRSARAQTSPAIRWPGRLAYLAVPIRLFGFGHGQLLDPVRFAPVLAAFGPALFMLGYGVSKTRSRWSDEILQRGIRYGVLSAIVAGLIEAAVTRFAHLAAMAPLYRAGGMALTAAITGEALKFFGVLWIAGRRAEAVQPRQLLLLSLAIGMGFAGFENLRFVIGPGNWEAGAVLRALTAVPAHAVFAIAMGALVTDAVLEGRNEVPRLALALLLCTALHAAYAFAAVADAEHFYAVPVPAFFIVLGLGALFAVWMANVTLAEVPDDDEWRAWRDRRSGAPAALLMSTLALLAILFSLAAVYFAMPGDAIWPRDAIWLMAAGCMLPCALGLDLLWTGLKRRAEATAYGYR